MFKLYPQQQQITNQLLDAFAQPNLYTLNSFYLSGEPGSGKTYMGSAVASQHLKTHQVLLVSPSQVIPKWIEVLTQACGKDAGIQYLKRTQVSTFNPDCPITILDPRSFYTFSNDDNPIVFSKPVLLIYDEIHTLSGKGYDSLKALLKQIFVNQNSHVLYLTGTIFSQNVADLARLMVITHPHLADPTTLSDHNSERWFEYSNPNESEAIKRFTNLYGSHLPRFVHDIWQYCSVSIAIEDVKEKTSDEFVEQTIAPITPLALSREQQLFSAVIESQLNAAGLSHEKAQMIVSDSLDYPSSMTISRRSQSFKSTNGVSRTTKLANGLYTSIPLTPIPFEQTSKMQALLKLLSESGDDHILIYCSNPVIIRELVKVLKAHNYNCLDASIYPPFEIAQQMNAAWEAGCKICVVDPAKVTTGVDLYAEQCVWYQLLPNVTDIIQAQRRIRRLSSTTNSVVTYLLYENTYQEELALQLSNVSKFNAATYGVKQTDPLAQLTGILLGELDS